MNAKLEPASSLQPPASPPGRPVRRFAQRLRASCTRSVKVAVTESAPLPQEQVLIRQGFPQGLTLESLAHRLTMATTAGEVEGVRKNFIPRIAGLTPDAIILANDQCDERIHGITGIQMPSTSSAGPLAKDEKTERILNIGLTQVAILDMVGQEDYAQALSLVEGLEHQLRVLLIAQYADAAGVVAP